MQILSFFINAKITDRLKLLPIKQYLLYSIIFFILLFNILIPSVFTSDYSVARIVEVEYPLSIQSGQTFSISVIAEYVDSFYVDIGIRDTDKDTIIQSYTFINSYHGPGEEIFEFVLEAPQKEGVWNLEAITRAWWKGSWYADPNQGSSHFELFVSSQEESIQSKDTLLILNTIFQDITITIDQTEYQLKEDTHLSLPAGEHIISVDPVIEFSNRTRLIFNEWSDGINSHQRRILLPSGASYSLTPIYQQQYFLEVKSSFNATRGEGWYAFNEIAHLESLPTVIINKQAYTFQGWKGDITSKSISTSILIDKPYRVEVVWTEKIQPFNFSLLLIIISVVLITFSIVNILFITRKRSLLLCFLGLLLSSPLIIQIPSVDCQSTSIVIGDTQWRYWETLGTDTCLIWLGGGIAGSKTFINPYWLESYNTRQFIEDLSRYYSVLVIEKGSVSMIQQPQNRVVHGEVYKRGDFVEDARQWAINAGYSHIYLIGYSVGGIAAIEESLLYNPKVWSSPHGIILITAPISKIIQNYADQLTANLLLLYGEGMTPFYITAGKKFYDAAPLEGLYGNKWFHKEVHIFPKVAHEVWTIAETGKYTSAPFHFIISFIEKSKTLYYSMGEQQTFENILEKDATLKTKIELIEFQNDPAKIYITVSGLPEGNYFFITDPMKGENPASITTQNITKEEIIDILLIVPYSPQEDTEFRILVLNTYFPKTYVLLDTLTIESKLLNPLTISTNYPEVTIQVDDKRYQSDMKGYLRLDTAPDLHTIEIEAILRFNNGTRLKFIRWIEKDDNSTRIIIDTTTTTHLSAIYTRQYYIEMYTPIGNVTEGGWFDEKSTVLLTVKPQIITVNSTTYLFDKWSPKRIFEPDGTLYIDRPSNIKAVWKAISLSSEKNNILLQIGGFEIIILIPVLTVFVATTLLLSKIQRSKQKL